MSYREIVLSINGSDRATAYGMSGKVIQRDRMYLCTWLGADRRNRLAVVDGTTGAIHGELPIGDVRLDNHCGAALGMEADGTLHVVTGAHHGEFDHYIGTGKEAVSWKRIAAVGKGATYPSLAVDAEGTVHLTYRARNTGTSPYPYELRYCRRPKGEEWSNPRPLIRASIVEHTWLTNAVEAGPQGSVHVVVSNTRRRSDGSIYYGASHIYSEDAGRTWKNSGSGTPLVTPAEMGSLSPIESAGSAGTRTEPSPQWERGPGCYYYNEILLSNPAVDYAGVPWVVVANLLAGDATLYGFRDHAWHAYVELRPVLDDAFPGYSITHGSQIGVSGDGSLEIVLTVVPAGAGRNWGDMRTELVRLVIDSDGTVRPAAFVCRPEDRRAHWLPSVERRSVSGARPALLYTSGVNAGGFDRNVNDVPCEVRLQIPQ